MPSARARKHRRALPRGAPQGVERLTAPAPAPRNPLVAPAARRKAGAHQTSRATTRQQARRELQGELRRLTRRGKG